MSSQSQSQSQSRFKTSFEFPSSQDCSPTSSDRPPSNNKPDTSSSKKRKASDLSQQSKGTSRSKRKLTAPSPPRLSKPPLSTDKLWIDEYSPKSTDQLVVHSGKVKQVREWLASTYKAKPFLVVTGPAGTGKLSTVLSLAAELDLRVLEWVNPLFAGSGTVNDDDDDDSRFASNSPSVIQSFLDFVSRGSRYSQPNDLLLFRDYPIFSKSGLERTHAVLGSLLRSRSRIPRVVFLFTDFNVPESDNGQLGPPSRSASSNLDCPSSRDVLPASCAHATHTIAFNAVAPTLMKKALKRIAHERSLVSAAQLDSIIQSSHGDLRAAINTLQFAHLSPVTSATASTPFTVECTTEQSRSLFRAVGRCLYAQRLPLPAGYTRAPLPPHLDKAWSRDPLEVDINTVLTNLAVSGDLFALFLHANYPEHIRPLGAHVFVADAFVDADVLQRAGRAIGGGSYGTGSSAPDFVRAHALALAKGMVEDELDRDLNAFMAVHAAGIDWDDFDMDADDEDGEQTKSSQVVDELVSGVNWDEFDSHPRETAGMSAYGLPTPKSHLDEPQHQVVHLDSSPEPTLASSSSISSQLSHAQLPLADATSTPPTSQLSQHDPSSVPPPPERSALPVASSSAKPPPSGNRFQALISSDHWAARRAYIDRSASLLRLGLRPEEAPFSRVFSNPNRRFGKRFMESAAAGAVPGEEAQEEAQAPRLMALLPEGKCARWYLCAAMQGGAPSWLDPFSQGAQQRRGAGSSLVTGLEEEEESDEIADG